MDKKEAIENIGEDGYGFETLPDEFKKDKDIALEAVKRFGYALEYADNSLKKDKEIVLAAVKQDGGALQYADDSFKKDKEIVLEAVKSSGDALEYADDSFKKDKEIVLIAVKQEGNALQYADDSFKKDKEIVLAAVKSNGYVFEYVNDSFKKDREIVLAAVKNSNNALQYADDSFKKDKEIILEAVKASGNNLQYADDSLKKDKEIVDAAVKQDDRASQYADISLKKYYKITQEIYIKTEPGGRVAFGKLNKTQEELFYKNYSKKEDINESLLYLANSGMITEYEGVVNRGKEGEKGNVGIIVFEKDCLVEIPKKNNEYEEGVYLTYLSLSKVSIQFEFEIKDKKEFDPKQFKEISVPIKLPDIIKHERYRHPNFNVVIDYLYKDKPIEEYQSHELTNRGYDDQIIFFEVKDGKTKILYSSYNGAGKFL
jgi:general stress protein YciG